jgi:hypothetical protein
MANVVKEQNNQETDLHKRLAERRQQKKNVTTVQQGNDNRRQSSNRPPCPSQQQINFYNNQEVSRPSSASSKNLQVKDLVSSRRHSISGNTSQLF